MGTSFKCDSTQIFTSVNKYRNIQTLVIETLGLANATNYPSVINNSTSSGFISVSLYDKLILEFLCNQLKNNISSFGIYVQILDNNNSKKPLDYGLLTPTASDSIWCVKLISDIPKTDFNLTSSLRSSPQYSSISDVKKLLFQKDRNIPLFSSSLLVNENYNSLVDIGNTVTENTFDTTKFDLGLGIQHNNSNDNTSFTASPEKVLKIIDPIEFLTDKYFATLYGKSTMIEHFVKSSIPKMHILRRDNSKLAKDCLSKLLIESLIDFDKRHDFGLESVNVIKLDIFKSNWLATEKLIADTERSFRLEIIDKMNMPDTIIEADKEKLSRFLDKFKLKDLKLQILLGFELLKLLKLEKKEVELHNKEVSLVIDDLKPQKKEKRPLLISKRYSNPLVGKKKRLIPTLLGTVIPTSMDFDVDFRVQDKQEKNTQYTVNGIEDLIKVLFDKLCVYDAIMGLDYKEIDSSWGFLSNCVIPFYETDHRPLLCNLAIKSRGPTFALKRKSQKERKKLREKRKERKEKEKQVQDNFKLERKTTNIDLSRLKLQRSHSSFGNSKADLSRKTFSMTRSVTSGINSTENEPDLNNYFIQAPELEDSVKVVESALKESRGFMHSKKRKLLAPQKATRLRSGKLSSNPKNNETDSEPPAAIIADTENDRSLFRPNQIIEATPRKNTIKKAANDLHDSIFSPSNIKTDSVKFQYTSPEKANTAKTEISETPMKERVQVRPGVFEIGSSPMKSEETPKKRLTQFQSIIETPEQQIVASSSPATRILTEPRKTPLTKSTKRKLDFN